MSGRVVLAMSGGVDSSAAAVMLRQQGYEVIGSFMRSGATEEASAYRPTHCCPYRQPQPQEGCCSASDAAEEHARRVADRMDIPFHALNFQNAFGRIKDYFVDEYLSGRTPNPCVQCNNWLKFGKLWISHVKLVPITLRPVTAPGSKPFPGSLNLHCWKGARPDKGPVLRLVWPASRVAAECVISRRWEHQSRNP